MRVQDEAIATLGGGCFWCLEEVYTQVRGVARVVSGYAGGERPDPSYAEVCSGRSGHIEVVQVGYDPRQIGYRELLEIFFAIHDPTSRDRQGADVGSQYRSVIFYHDDAQRSEAERLIAELEAGGGLPGPIVTELRPAPTFYPAEAHHQGYYRRNPNQGYCQVVIAPKLQKLRQRFADRLAQG